MCTDLSAFAVLCIALAISLVEHKMNLEGSEEAALTLNVVARQVEMRPSPHILCRRESMACV